MCPVNVASLCSSKRVPGERAAVERDLSCQIRIERSEEAEASVSAERVAIDQMRSVCAECCRLSAPSVWYARIDLSRPAARTRLDSTLWVVVPTPMLASECTACPQAMGELGRGKLRARSDDEARCLPALPVAVNSGAGVNGTLAADSAVSMEIAGGATGRLPHLLVAAATVPSAILWPTVETP